MFRKSTDFVALLISSLFALGLLGVQRSVLFAEETAAVFQAGAARVDITPEKLPVVVNGNFFPRYVDKVLDPLFARCLILNDGNETIVWLVVDTCILPLSLCEEVKSQIQSELGIPKDRVVISATHCHSAPSLDFTLGVSADHDYIVYLRGRIVETVSAAQKNLVPAKVGWAVGNDPNNVFCRRFLMKEGTAMTNPFGGKKYDRAMMNPGVRNPNSIARTGPVDTSVSVLSVMTIDDKPIAVLANYSTHYAGVPGDVLSGDYFGVFAEKMREMIAEKIGASNMPDTFVGIMTNGTSGDANCIDFLNPNRTFDYQSVGRETAEAAMAVWSAIEYHRWVPLGMIERRITIVNRVPTAEEVEAAKKHLQQLADGVLKTIPDVYAQSTVAMADWAKTSEIPLQAMRIGELGVTAIPAEVYGMTGLEIKARSPFRPTFNMSLANGCFGYIPPPEQHALGGYNTWRTQTSCLEVDAETVIKKNLIEMLKLLDEKR